MRHSLEHHVVDESGFAVELRRQIDARGIAADNRIIRNRLMRRGSGRLARQAHELRERPIIKLRRCTVVQDAAVVNREFRRGATKALCRSIEKQRARLGAGRAQRDAARLHRLAAGGIALVRRAVGVARADGYALKRDIELFGGDLGHRGEHALAEFDASSRKLDLARRGEIQPSIEAGIIGEHARQRHGNVMGGRLRASGPRLFRRRAKSGYAHRSGKYCRQGRGRFPPATATDCGRAAPWPK